MREILDLAVRWVHVIAGIMWIGNSLLWNWLDRNLQVPERPARDGQGEIWLLHSGGFYYVEKTMLVGQPLPRPLHWFKWQAYTTWLSGFLLLVIVYWLGGASLLVDPAVAALTPAQAIGLSLGLLVVGWAVYDRLVAPALGRLGPAGAALGFALVLAAAFGLTRLFSGRAAFLHIGAMLGTLMAGNVAMHIMPSQRRLVAAVRAGKGADPVLAARAKTRSIHNNYMTFPVIALMVSAHFPSLYGHPLSWLLLGVLALAGALVRHFMNIRFTYARWRPALFATVAAALATLWLLAARPAERRGGSVGDEAAAGDVAFDDVRRIIDRRCAACHSRSPSDRTFGPAPAGVAFDSPAEIRARADRILARAVATETMPPANKTWITPAERRVLGRWIEGGARIE